MPVKHPQFASPTGPRLEPKGKAMPETFESYPEAERKNGEAVGFNYGAVDERTADLARKAAARIRPSLRAHSKVRFEIGRELCNIKKTVPHGLFEPWIQAEFGWSVRTAQRYMRLVEVFGAKGDSLSLMTTSTLHQLAARSTPSRVRSAVLGRVEAGETLKEGEISALIRE